MVVTGLPKRIQRKRVNNAVTRHYEIMRASVDRLDNAQKEYRKVSDPALRRTPKRPTLSEIDGERNGS